MNPCWVVLCILTPFSELQWHCMHSIFHHSYVYSVDYNIRYELWVYGYVRSIKCYTIWFAHSRRTRRIRIRIRTYILYFGSYVFLYFWLSHELTSCKASTLTTIITRYTRLPSLLKPIANMIMMQSQPP